MRTYKKKRLQSLRKGSKVENSESQQCLVCMDIPSLDSDKGILECFHQSFCFKCIIDWSNITNRCPLCKERFYTVTNSNTKEVVIINEKDQIIAYENGTLIEIRCIICGSDLDDEIMLLCDTCDRGFHTTCLNMNGIPNIEEWHCDECIWELNDFQRKKLLIAMKKVGRCIDFEVVETDKKSRKRLRKLNDYPQARIQK